MPKYRFPKSARLTSKSDFRAVLDYKLFAKNNLMTLHMAPNGASRSRFAASISAKTAPAVIRNRLKRLAREAFRLSQNEIAAGFDYLLIYSPMLSKWSRSDINPVRGKASKMPDGCPRQPTSNGIKKITLNEVRQSFMELAEKGQRLFEKRHNK
ncbi:MAG: ribonuclease P protein component [Phycisphaerae bacterium]|nr:ribonuclease P protein component [Phycisphaerae bacterium]